MAFEAMHPVAMSNDITLIIIFFIGYSESSVFLTQLFEFSLENAAQSLEVACLTVDVVADNVYFIKQFACSILNGVGLAECLVSLWVDNDINAFFDDFDIDVCIGVGRISIVMNDTRLLAMDMQLFTLECLYLRTFVKGFAEHLDADLGCVKNIERFHDDDIKQTVAHRCLRRDVGVIAIL